MDNYGYRLFSPNFKSILKIFGLRDNKKIAYMLEINTDRTDRGIIKTI